MKALLNTAVELCLLRLGPQQLPASPILLQVSLILNLLVGVLVMMAAKEGFLEAVAVSLFELALMLGVLYMGLKSYNKLRRFNQTASALLISGLLLGLLSLPLVSWNHRSQSAESSLLLLLLIFWSILVLGHILRHAFSVPLNVGIAIGVAYTLFSWNLLALLFPVAT
ncbi:MAG: hypothetical protein P8178_10830 [Candidatus Thiodiazotropha sp.]